LPISTGTTLLSSFTPTGKKGALLCFRSLEEGPTRVAAEVEGLRVTVGNSRPGLEVEGPGPVEGLGV